MKMMEMMDSIAEIVGKIPDDGLLILVTSLVIVISIVVIRADEIQIKIKKFFLKVSRKSSASLPDEDPPKPNSEPLEFADNTFQDQLSFGGKGPVMKEIPAGDFRMGSPRSEKGRYSYEGRVHKVKIKVSFAVSIHEVTFDEWDVCVDAGGCNDYRPDDEGWGRGRRPVINVSWKDAKSYVGWLSAQTGKEYRLLSESEWEYVARAGTTTRYWWGDKVGFNRANCKDCGSHWDDAKTAPVGSFSPNPFGLYDVHGNVYEWVEDCWHESYKNAPADGSAWRSDDGGNCGLRVLRGGSWGGIPEFLRSAYRGGDTADRRNLNGGFRIARTLP